MPECPSMTFTMDHEVSSTLFTVACPAVRPSGPCTVTCADRGYPARRGRVERRGEVGLGASICTCELESRGMKLSEGNDQADSVTSID